MEKKQKIFSARRSNWDNRPTPFQRKNTESNRKSQTNNQMTSKTNDELPQKVAQGVKIQENSTKKGGTNNTLSKTKLGEMLPLWTTRTRAFIK